MRGAAALMAGWAALVGLPGCTTDSTVRVRSIDSAVMDAPTLATSAYSSTDPNTADIYLTDLDTGALDRGTDLSKVAGRITHIHMFVAPLAGSTPIASSACSVTVRHIVLADGAIGVYSGGGFLSASGRPGDDAFGGTISNATLRLTGKTPSFADRLGPAVLNATVNARHDEGLAKRIGGRVEEVLRAVTPLARPAAGAEPKSEGGSH